METHPYQSTAAAMHPISELRVFRNLLIGCMAAYLAAANTARSITTSELNASARLRMIAVTKLVVCHA